MVAGRRSLLLVVIIPDRVEDRIHLLPIGIGSSTMTFKVLVKQLGRRRIAIVGVAKSLHLPVVVLADQALVLVNLLLVLESVVEKLLLISQGRL